MSLTSSSRYDGKVVGTKCTEWNALLSRAIVWGRILMYKIPCSLSQSGPPARRQLNRESEWGRVYVHVSLQSGSSAWRQLNRTSEWGRVYVHVSLQSGSSAWRQLNRTSEWGRVYVHVSLQSGSSARRLLNRESVGGRVYVHVSSQSGPSAWCQTIKMGKKNIMTKTKPYNRQKRNVTVVHRLRIELC